MAKQNVVNDDDELGLFLPKNKTLYVIRKTRWSIKNLNIERIRSILLARGLLDFGGSAVEDNRAEMSKFVPLQMTIAKAKEQGYVIEELYATATEKNRTEKIEEKTETVKTTNSRFKKK